MKILAIDTSSAICSVCVLEDSNVICKKELKDSKTHSQKLMPMIDAVLKTANLALKDIHLLACCVGPGSFTGVRIGVATVKAFSDSLSIPVIGINSLEALACNVETSYFHEEKNYICTLIDAKNENVYYGLYEVTSNGYSIVGELQAQNIYTVIENLATLQKPIVFVGDGAIAYQYKIMEKIKNCTFVTDAFHKQTSVSIGKRAFYYFQQGKSGDSNSLSPLYLRKSQAERALEGEK